MAPHSLGSPLLSSGGVHKCRNKQATHKARHSGSISSLERSPASSLSASPSVSITSDTADAAKCASTDADVPQLLRPCTDTRPASPSNEPEFLTANPTNTISRSNRRSSSLSQCMMKERMSYRAMGRDKEGYLVYALHIEESQGFKWNRNLSRLNGSHFGSDQAVSMLGSALYDFSSDSDSDSEDVSVHETLFISDQHF